MAATIRAYVPQRQMLPFIARTISASVGFAVFVQQRQRGHDHARRAVAALQCAHVPERLLQRVQLAVAREALDGRDLLAGEVADFPLARARRLAIDQDGAGAALAFAAAVLAAGQIEIVAQHAEQRALGVRLDRHGAAIDVKFFDAWPWNASESGLPRIGRWRRKSGFGENGGRFHCALRLEVSTRGSVGRPAAAWHRKLVPVGERHHARFVVRNCKPRSCASLPFWNTA